MQTRFLTRTVTTAFLALLLAGTALVATAPAAGALSTSAQSDVQYGNNDCGDVVLGAPVIGSARFVRSGDLLTVRYAMTAGDANTAYAVYVFDADTCTALSKVGSFTTDASGAGRSTSKPVSVAGSDRFYAAAVDVSNFVGIRHGSLAVDLP